MGIEKDIIKAREWYQKAIDEKVEAANYHMAGTYMNENIEKAIELYEKAYTEGDIYSVYMLASIYEEEIYNKKDAEKALKWMELMVYANNDNFSKYKIAQIYLEKYKKAGDKNDKIRAYAWFLILMKDKNSLKNKEDIPEDEYYEEEIDEIYFENIEKEASELAKEMTETEIEEVKKEMLKIEENIKK